MAKAYRLLIYNAPAEKLETWLGQSLPEGTRTNRPGETITVVTIKGLGWWWRLRQLGRCLRG